jgi:ketosteroid isomerase-like protein
MPPGLRRSTPRTPPSWPPADIKLGGKLTLTTEDVVGFGNYAVETGKWVANSPDGKHLDHGPYIVVYKRTDGGWKMYQDIWNSSMPKQ